MVNPLCLLHRRMVKLSATNTGKIILAIYETVSDLANISDGDTDDPQTADKMYRTI